MLMDADGVGFCQSNLSSKGCPGNLAKNEFGKRLIKTAFTGCLEIGNWDCCLDEATIQ